MESGLDRGRVPDIGQSAPDFELFDADGRAVRLSELRGQPVVLAFFPEDWDPARPQQLALYEEALRKVGGGRLLGVTQDGFWCDVDVQGEAPMRFPLLRDLSSEGEVGALYGLSGEQAVFLLDGEGVVRWRSLSPLGVHPRVEEVMDALRDLTPKTGISRRELLIATAAAAVALTLLPRAAEAAGFAPRGQRGVPGGRNITLNVNGKDYRVPVEPRVSLLDALRERIGLTGTKKGCDHGQCGACTVHMNGRRVNSCLTLAMQAEGAKITTIEGLAEGDRLHPVQAAFIKHDGFQCGYCTPGQIMSAVACIHEGHADTDENIKEFMSGNICRCGAYPGICAAVKEARDTMGGHR